METVTVLRELWRRRFLVGVVACLAVFACLALTFRPSFPPESRKYEVGVASGRVLVDTPSSQTVTVSPKGSETLGERASLLANLMTEGEVKQAIAKRAGLRPGQLVAVSESAVEPTAAPAAGPVEPRGYVLTTRLVTNASGDPLPIIEIEAQAPDAARAGRLATAAIGGLDAYLDSKAVVEKVSDARRLRVSGLGAPQVRVVERGPRRVIALGAAVFIFLAGCAAILLVSGLARSWRAASEREQDELHAEAVATSLTSLPSQPQFPPDLGDEGRPNSVTEARVETA